MSISCISVGADDDRMSGSSIPVSSVEEPVSFPFIRFLAMSSAHRRGRDISDADASSSERDVFSFNKKSSSFVEDCAEDES